MDPFSKAIRRYLPPDECVRLSRMLSSKSLIGRQEFSTDEATRRVAELTGIEQQYGFVFVGEKQWIEYCHFQGPTVSYEAWAEKQALEIFSKPSRVVDGPTELSEDIGKLRYYSENLGPIVLFDSLQKECVSIDDVSVLMPPYFNSDKRFLHSQIFEVLHNLVYSVYSASTSLAQIGQSIIDWSFHEVEVHADSREWTMLLISDYGGVIEYTFRSSTSWAWSQFLGQVT